VVLGEKPWGRRPVLGLPIPHVRRMLSERAGRSQLLQRESVARSGHSRCIGTPDASKTARAAELTVSIAAELLNLRGRRVAEKSRKIVKRLLIQFVGSLALYSEEGSITNHRPFGRRGEPARQFSRSTGSIEAVPQTTAVQSAGYELLLSEKSEASSLDDDFREWKRARRQNFAIPWRPLSLLATVFFGVASFVLPDSVNDIFQWPLYALGAASLYVGFRRRHRQAKI
jgi:hypothetical protein